MESIAYIAIFLGLIYFTIKGLIIAFTYNMIMGVLLLLFAAPVLPLIGLLVW